MESTLPNDVLFAEEVDNKLVEHAPCEVEVTPAPQLVEAPSVPAESA